MTRASRNFGRHKLDKIALGTVVLLTGLLVSRCNKGGVSEPTPVEPAVSAQQPVASAPTPAPQPVEGQPEGSLLKVDFLNDATFEAFNLDNDPHNITAYITSFDNQDLKLAEKQQLVAAGKSWNDSFDRQCVQLDVLGVGAEAHAYYDAAGKPFFNPHANKDKIDECRQCKPGEWEITEKGEPYRGEIVKCPDQPEASVAQVCYECREKLVDIIETNGCDKRARTIVEEIKRYVVNCPCEPIDGSSNRHDDYYCKSPLGSEGAEAGWLNVDLASFVKKVEGDENFSDGDHCWTSDGNYDTVLLKGGRSLCGHNENLYKVFHNVSAGNKLCFLTTDISHVTIFDGKSCDN